MATMDEQRRRELGGHLRGLRQAKGLTLAQLASSVGVSTSALSQIERGVTEPSLGTLWRLNDALGSSLFDFFNQPARARVQVCRPPDRAVVSFNGYTYRTLTQATSRRLDLFYLELEASDGPVRPPISHYGEECGLVIEGTLEVHVADDVHVLEPEDSIWFISTQPHTFRARGPERCVSIWTNTLPERPKDEGPFADGLAIR